MKASNQSKFLNSSSAVGPPVFLLYDDEKLSLPDFCVLFDQFSFNEDNSSSKGLSLLISAAAEKTNHRLRYQFEL